MLRGKNLETHSQVAEGLFHYSGMVSRGSFQRFSAPCPYVSKLTQILLERRSNLLRSTQKPEQKVSRKGPPATTPEARENQLISLAVDLVEQRLLNGTASSQETTHFLKLGSTIARLDKEILEKQKDLITAKTESIQSAKRMESLYKDAMKAFSTYSGNTRGGVEDDE